MPPQPNPLSIHNALSVELAEQIHAAAKENGVSARELHDSGLGHFINIDSVSLTSPFDLGRAALDLAIGADGHWEGVALTILQGILGFMSLHNFAWPTREQFRSIQSLLASSANRPALEGWFDDVFSPDAPKG